MIMVWKKRSLRADVANSGPIMAALYQKFNALPSSCGITGASATTSNPENFRDFPGVISTGRATRTISFDLHFSPLGSSKSQFPSSGERRLLACSRRQLADDTRASQKILGPKRSKSSPASCRKQQAGSLCFQKESATVSRSRAQILRRGMFDPLDHAAC